MKKPKPSGEKKPERRFVVGYERCWSVWAETVSPAGIGRMTLTEAKREAKKAKPIEGRPTTIYELVPVAGGRKNAKR